MATQKAKQAQDNFDGMKAHLLERLKEHRGFESLEAFESYAKGFLDQRMFNIMKYSNTLSELWNEYVQAEKRTAAEEPAAAPAEVAEVSEVAQALNIIKRPRKAKQAAQVEVAEAPVPAAQAEAEPAPRTVADNIQILKVSIEVKGLAGGTLSDFEELALEIFGEREYDDMIHTGAIGRLHSEMNPAPVEESELPPALQPGDIEFTGTEQGAEFQAVNASGDLVKVDPAPVAEVAEASAPDRSAAVQKALRDAEFEFTRASQQLNMIHHEMKRLVAHADMISQDMAALLQLMTTLAGEAPEPVASPRKQAKRKEQKVVAASGAEKTARQKIEEALDANTDRALSSKELAELTGLSVKQVNNTTWAMKIKPVNGYYSR